MTDENENTQQIKDLKKEDLFDDIQLTEKNQTVQIEDIKIGDAFSDVDIDEDEDEDEDRPTVLLDDISSDAFSDIEIEDDEDEDEDDNKPTVLLSDIDLGDLDDDSDDSRPTVLLDDISSDAFSDIEIDDDDSGDDEERPTVLLEDVQTSRIIEDVNEGNFESVKINEEVKLDNLEVEAPLEFEKVNDTSTEPDEMFSGLESVGTQLDVVTKSDMPEEDLENIESMADLGLDKLQDESISQDLAEIVNLRGNTDSKLSSESETGISLANEIREDKKYTEVFSVDSSTDTDMEDNIQLDESLRSINEPAAIRLQATIRQLRNERKQLLNDIKHLKQNQAIVDQENLGMRSELDELKIELTLTKKRKEKEVSQLKQKVDVFNHRLEIVGEKNKRYKLEFDKINQRVKVDFNQVRHKEQELENKLELLKVDAQIQIESRDKKILDLQRKIDSLEFNMENLSIRENKSREDKINAEEKLARIMNSIKKSVNQVEKDLEMDEDWLMNLTKE